MTPMIDVLLVLIIIFMVITPLTPTGLRTLVPQPPSRDQQDIAPAGAIVVTVEAGGRVLLNREHADMSTLPARLAQIVRVRGDCVIFVRGDRNLRFDQVAGVIDIANGAGLHRVALMTE